MTTDSAEQGRVDPADLGALLVVMHGADGPRGRVEVTYRVWRHQERSHAAFIADAEEQKRRSLRSPDNPDIPTAWWHCDRHRSVPPTSGFHQSDGVAKRRSDIELLNT